MGGSLSEHSEMPQPRELSPEEKLRRTFTEENFSRIEMHEIVDSLAHKLNAGQAQLCEDLYQAVHMAAVSDPHYNAQVPPFSSSPAQMPKNKVFILSSPGGYGTKLFLPKLEVRVVLYSM